MILKEFIKQFRQYSNDNEEPYLFSKEEITVCVYEALKFYSKKNPILKEGCIDTVPQQKKYALPFDYQTWYEGLENVDIAGNDVITAQAGYGRISFLYYADRKFCEVPKEDLPLFFTYCLGAMLEKQAVKLARGTEGDIKAMKLGRGLELTFDEGKNVREELLAIAHAQKKKFFDSIKGKCRGSWI